MILPTPQEGFDAAVEIAIVGAGACGLVAALAAQEAGATPLVIERDPVPRGSTALSAGLIPAAGTRWQATAGIADDADTFANDIMRKAHGEPRPEIVAALTANAAETLHWLADCHELPLSLVDDFDYPGHSARRMHGVPSRTGADLLDHLRQAAEAVDVDILYGRPVTALHAEGDRVTGLTITAPDGTTERVGCAALVLACNGFGGDRALVRRHMPEIADALWFGHDGNKGDALRWGEALGGATRHLGAYQGHGSVAHPEGILISWAVVGEGGFQVNADGNRFWNESQGYSEAARAVLAQPGGVAWCIFDRRIAGVAAQFGDFRQAEAAGAVRRANSIGALAGLCDLPADTLAQTASAVESAKAGAGACPYGRKFKGALALEPPFCAVRVTGALFHTQGGLDVDPAARVLCANGTGTLPNLLAAGGAACGVSGTDDSGYLSGNGLLSAVVMGRLAGQSAARLRA